MFSDLADMAAGTVTDVIGVPAVYQYEDTTTIDLHGIYEKNRAIYDGDSGEITGYAEVITVRASELPTKPAQNDQITFNDQPYTVIDFTQDEHASYTLYLRLK